jgi:hypothetical protein
MLNGPRAPSSFHVIELQLPLHVLPRYIASVRKIESKQTLENPSDTVTTSHQQLQASAMAAGLKTIIALSFVRLPPPPHPMSPSYSAASPLYLPPLPSLSLSIPDHT